MGQYYKPTCINRKEHIYSHDFDEGLKLMEHSYIGNNLVNVAMLMLFDDSIAKRYTHKENGIWTAWNFQGAWSGLKFVWAGDYADGEKELPYTYEQIKDSEEKGYELEEPGNNWYHATDKLVFPFNECHFSIGFYISLYLYNLDLNEFVSLKEYIFKAHRDKYDFIIHPLPLLTCDGNGRGGGDFHDEKDKFKNYIERWKKDRIVISKLKPNVMDGMKGQWRDITKDCLFKENR